MKLDVERIEEMLQWSIQDRLSEYYGLELIAFNAREINGELVYSARVTDTVAGISTLVRGSVNEDLDDDDKLIDRVWEKIFDDIQP